MTKLFEKVAVHLSDPQVLLLGKELAEKQIAYNALAEEKKEALSTFNSKLATLEAEINEVARQVNDRKEEKDIEVIEEPDDARKMVAVKDAASGRILRTRKMTLEEISDAEYRARQGNLPLEEGHEESSESEASDTDRPPPPAEKPSRRRRLRVVEPAADDAPDTDASDEG